MRVIATALVSVALQLGVAVWGWGGFGPFFGNSALVAMVAVTFALTISSVFTSGNMSSGVYEDRSNRWVIGVFALLGIALAYVSAYTDRHSIATIDGETTRWVGLAIYAAGGVLRLWPVFVLGSRFSGLVAIQPGHALVTTGIYRYVRNPSYLGLLVGALGWALVFRSAAGIVITALLLVPLVSRMNAEERLLFEQFGDAYTAYRARTWRLLPGMY
jgi:protein-S-isoprenylcysteine O-methyltransferase Ste14